MRYTAFFTILLFSSGLLAQDVVSRDGVIIGDRTELINFCRENLEAEQDEMGMDLSFMCDCMIDELLPQMDSEDVSFEEGELIFSNEDNDEHNLILFECLMNKKALDDGENEVFKEMLIAACIEGMLENEEASSYYSEDEMYAYCGCAIDKILSGDFSYEQISDIEKEGNPIFNDVVISCIQDLNPKAMCIKGLKSVEGFGEHFSEESIEQYCDCAMEKLMSGEYNYNEMSNYSNPDGTVYNEVLLSCINDYLMPEIQDQTDSNIIIKGSHEVQKIPLFSDFDNGYKAKVSIGGVSSYFLIDTGATDIAINTILESELLNKGILKSENYTGVSDYRLADGQIIKARTILLNEIQIGEYRIENVKAAVLEGGSLLLGHKLLNQFKKWELNKDSNELILYK